MMVRKLEICLYDEFVSYNRYYRKVIDHNLKGQNMPNTCHIPQLIYFGHIFAMWIDHLDKYYWLYNWDIVFSGLKHVKAPMHNQQLFAILYDFESMASNMNMPTAVCK